MRAPSTRIRLFPFSPSFSSFSRLLRLRLTSWLPLFALLLLPACSRENESSRHARVFEAWDVINEPSRFGRSYVVTYRDLPSSGKLAKIPWSDSYWATQRAGIAYRWMSPAGSPFFYSLPNRQMVQSMSRNELADLSPAEKLDIFAGRFDFPTVKSERKRTYPGAPAWEGLCHGWAPAALAYAEPRPVTLKGPSGISVPFGSSDVKALLTWHMALRNTSPALGLGARCNTFGTLGLNTPACRDANAGSFHVVLANQIGRLKEGFIADIARMGEVWNQPVYAYQSRELSRQRPSPGAAVGTVEEVLIETQMQYTTEIEPQWNALGQLVEAPLVASIYYRYRLELDGQGRIRGGVWLQDTRPDFIWLQLSSGFQGDDAHIGKIYEASLR